MATGNAIDFVYKQYTADDATTWSVKVDSDWGGAAAAGFGDFDPADPVWPTSARWRTRKVILQDLVSGRKTQRVLGASDATAGAAGATVVTVARGAAGSYTLTSLGTVGEKRPHAGTITHHPEPITT